MEEPFGPLSETAELLGKIDDVSALLAQKDMELSELRSTVERDRSAFDVMGYELEEARGRIKEALGVCWEDMAGDRAGWQVARDVRIRLVGERPTEALPPGVHR